MQELYMSMHGGARDTVLSMRTNNQRLHMLATIHPYDPELVLEKVGTHEAATFP